MTPQKLEIRSLYLRVCKDSRYSLSADRATKLVANILGISPLAVIYAMPSLAVMEEIAAGAHPATQHAVSP